MWLMVKTSAFLNILIIKGDKMTKIDTAEALRVAIFNIWGIHEYDNVNFTPEMQNAIHLLRSKLRDLTMTKIEVKK